MKGSPTKLFKDSQGLRQSDPLISISFATIMEELAALLRKAEELEIVYGIRAGDGNLVVSYLQFVNDLIIFLMDRAEKVRVKAILRFFKAGSRTKVNLSMSLLVG